MAKGAVSKALIFKKIMETFDGAFAYNDGKEIRIPMQEDGMEVQIKVALTCAKDNVVPGEDNTLPGSTKIENKTQEVLTFNNTTTEQVHVEPTAEEKENVKSLLEFLNL